MMMKRAQRCEVVTVSSTGLMRSCKQVCFYMRRWEPVEEETRLAFTIMEIIDSRNRSKRESEEKSASSWRHVHME